jgi:hypothetical protein
MMATFTMKECRDGNKVSRSVCPACDTAGEIYYNGNYWCASCGWVADENTDIRKIIDAYLIQCIEGTDDQEAKLRYASYLSGGK